MPEGVDAIWCLRQIEGYQLARKKLPQWADKEGIWFPPRLSMEQCSSEATARYKAEVAARLCSSITSGATSLIDLTGGFGVDFSYMAPQFGKAIYVEQQEVLCDAARHNFPLLGLGNTEIINAQSGEDFSLSNLHYSLIFLDPARRDDIGRKVFAIEDCTPDITALQDDLLKNADYVMVKLSPMLDITQALRSLHCVREIHVVSVKGECKELLFVMSNEASTEPLSYHCVNLDTQDEPFVTQGSQQTTEYAMPEKDMLLFEPNASIMKAGVQDAFAAHYSLGKLHPMSNLFTKKNDVDVPEGIPARAFRITHIYDFSKQSLKQLRNETKQANLTVRNFPSTVADLRKRLKLKEGGSIYIFATTVKDNRHILLSCVKNS